MVIFPRTSSTRAGRAFLEVVSITGLWLTASRVIGSEDQFHIQDQHGNDYGAVTLQQRWPTAARLSQPVVPNVRFLASMEHDLDDAKDLALLAAQHAVDTELRMELRRKEATRSIERAVIRNTHG